MGLVALQDPNTDDHGGYASLGFFRARLQLEYLWFGVRQMCLESQSTLTNGYKDWWVLWRVEVEAMVKLWLSPFLWPEKLQVRQMSRHERHLRCWM